VADDIDRANDRAQQHLEQSIQAVRSAASSLPAIGSCYNCDEPIAETKRFCDAACRDDWQRAHPGL
jgi:hypothetical protein